MIVIQPWEKSLIKAIEKAIQASDLGINPSNDGSVIRLVFPELTEDRRKELAKDVKKKGEAAKVAVRNIRRDANEAFKKQEKNNEISRGRFKGRHRTDSRRSPIRLSRKSTRRLRIRRRKSLRYKRNRGQGDLSLFCGRRKCRF